MGNLYKIMYFEIFEGEIKTLPPLIKDGNVTYAVLEGPNDSGKSSILNVSTHTIGETLPDTRIYAVVEPPYLHIPQLRSDKTVREFLKSGDAGSDPREPAGVFNLARRIIQGEVHSGNISTDNFVRMDSNVSTDNRPIVISDRGLPSTRVFQIKAEIELGGVKIANEIDDSIKLSYTKRYLLPYDLVIFMNPSGKQIPYDHEDYWEGKFDEKRLYRNEVTEMHSKCYYTNNIVWLDNDISGNTNNIGEPVLSAASAIIATRLNNTLEKGKIVEIPLVIPEDSLLPQKFGFKEIKSGNVVVTSKNNYEARVEFTENLPKVR